jgi:hypothetical protein
MYHGGEVYLVVHVEQLIELAFNVTMNFLSRIRSYRQLGGFPRVAQFRIPLVEAVSVLLDFSETALASNSPTLQSSFHSPTNNSFHDQTLS